ncbi:hypothetical protein QVD99_007733 [Batrachochytrium dendrobatidis]|nr:hypothetical protein QVD99_007733 [Batrachochytrium dendrobatidis]
MLPLPKQMKGLNTMDSIALDAPFDPTVYNPIEVERLRKSKWLPPIVETAKLTHTSVKRVDSLRQPQTLARKSDEFSRAFKPRGGDRFPMSEFIESEKRKKLLMVNSKIRFVHQMHDDALARQHKIETLERTQNANIALTYNWTSIKLLGKNIKFQQYISALEKRGMEHTVKSIAQGQPSAIVEKTDILLPTSLDRNSNPTSSSQSKYSQFPQLHHSVQSPLLCDEESNNQHLINHGNDANVTFCPTHLKQADSLETIRDSIDASRFRPKRKGGLSLRNHSDESAILFQNNYIFGKPVDFDHTDDDEFNHTFAEIINLGNAIADKSILINHDSSIYWAPSDTSFLN